MVWEDYLPLILTWGLALAAGTMLGFAFWSLRWPSVKGLVEVSFLEEVPNAEEHRLAYSYEVAGVKYLGANVKPWGDSTWRLGYGGDTDGLYQGRTIWSSAHDASKWYRPGAIVDVYFCPVRPQWACLEPGGFIVPCLLGGAAFGIWLFFVR